MGKKDVKSTVRIGFSLTYLFNLYLWIDEEERHMKRPFIKAYIAFQMPFQFGTLRKPVALKVRV